MSDFDTALNARLAYYETRSESERARAFALDSRRDPRAGRGVSWVHGSPAILINGEREVSPATGYGEFGPEDGRNVAERTHASHISAMARGTGTPELSSDREHVRHARTTSRAAWVNTVADAAMDAAASHVIVTADVIMARVIATGERSLLPAQV